MLYDKNKSEKLNTELFKNPTSEYRATPFWAWNCELDKELLLRQIDYLKKMGFGGFHMHSRSGMATEYLSDEFIELIKLCCDKAEDEGMLAWLYDEDRWPSGSAGGFVTKNKSFREKMLVISENKVDFCDKKTGAENGMPYLVAVYDIILDEDGKLKSYHMIEENEKAYGIKRYVYVKTAEEGGWYNGETYVDTLSKEAIGEFIRITYERYKKSVGDKFGKSIPAIFTDEPQFVRKQCLKFANSHEDIILPWTTDFDDTYKEYYKESIIPKIPELLWDLPNNEISYARYNYHDHICQRFVESFVKQCGEWCKKNRLMLTGHMMEEPTLLSQTSALGEAMRAYEWFDIPGMDMLCDRIEFTTAKQVQSAVHQYGKEGMTSELYGVTNWNFDFRGHKFQGDWQAALGVTVRVPHLAWVSMKGSAKRDYPASISYQSPWYKEYSYVENHYARLNTVLTRGKPIVNVGVIHPIESYWLHFGPQDTGSDIKNKLEERFNNITKWLISGLVDFDFISESLFPKQCKDIGDKLKVGCMEYKTVIVPGCETIRRSTFEILKKFSDCGGKIIFAGECPLYIDAQKSDEVFALYEKSVKVGFEKLEILEALKAEQEIEIRMDNGMKAYNLVHTMREDNEVKWLFIAHGERIRDKRFIDRAVSENLIITIDGEYIPTLYNTITGEIEKLEYETKNSKTYIYKTLYDFDSLLIELKQGSGEYFSQKADEKVINAIDFKKNVAYKREEDNVCLLDMAEYKLDEGEYSPTEEIIRIDGACRRILDYPNADGFCEQPWVLGKDKIEHYVTLKFEIISDTEIENVFIAGEEAEEIIFNGKKINLIPIGYYVDESIKKYNLGKLLNGVNRILIKAPIGKRTSIENYFLLGDFDVYARGCEKFITKASRTIGFSDITRQGLPFYGGNIIYSSEFDTAEDCDIWVKINRYRGAVIKVYVDRKEQGIIAYPPYILKIKGVNTGKHKIDFEFFGNRMNTFGAIHNTSNNPWSGPGMWYVKENEWSYDYNLDETGIISSPVIEIIEKTNQE